MTRQWLIAYFVFALRANTQLIHMLHSYGVFKSEYEVFHDFMRSLKTIFIQKRWLVNFMANKGGVIYACFEHPSRLSLNTRDAFKNTKKLTKKCKYRFSDENNKKIMSYTWTSGYTFQRKKEKLLFGDFKTQILSHIN